MAEIKELVLWDPSGEYWEGALVRPGPNAEELRRRGVALLVVDKHLLQGCSMGGYVKRAWGSGWRVSQLASSHCQVAMYLHDGMSTLRWCARLVPYELEEGAKPEGWLRLLPDAGQPPLHAAPVLDTDRNKVDLGLMGKPDASGGWTIEGEAGCGAMGAGFFAMCLHGMGSGARVAWLAVSQTL